MAKGWIRLHRQIQECGIWVDKEPFDRRSAWLDLLLMANYEDKSTLIKGKPLTIDRGQRFTSTLHLAERWHWSVNRVRRYLALLESLQMITTDRTSNGIMITIVKYGDYQIGRTTDDIADETTDGITDGIADGITDGTRIKNIKKERNKEKNINIYVIDKYSSSFNEFWNNYPRKQDKGQAYKCYQARLNDGYTEEQLLTACKNYADECKREKRDRKYTKVASTFLSVNEPFVDYLKGDSESNDSVASRSREDEKQRIAEIKRYLESDEFKHADDELPFM